MGQVNGKEEWRLYSYNQRLFDFSTVIKAIIFVYKLYLSIPAVSVWDLLQCS